MVKNPFESGGGLSIEIDSDTSGLTGGVDDAIGKLGDFKTAALGVSGVMAGGLAAGLATSVSKASDFSDAMIGVEKVTNPQVAKEMEGAIMDMSESMPIAQDKLAGIAEQAGRLGVEGSEDISAFTETAGSRRASSARRSTRRSAPSSSTLRRSDAVSTAPHPRGRCSHRRVFSGR